jgi:Methyltransferase domain
MRHTGCLISAVGRGIDPEPEMLKIAREEAARASVPIEFKEGTSSDLGVDLGVFRLATIGRAFHWMDRQQTLSRLDSIIELGGAVVLFGDEHPKVPDNRWTESFDQLIDRYAEHDPVRTALRGPDWLRHEAVLLHSPFRRLDRLGVSERRTTPLEHLIDRALSISSISLGETGTRAVDFVQEIRQTLGPFVSEGSVVEVVESTALVARRNPI